MLFWNFFSIEYIHLLNLLLIVVSIVDLMSNNKKNYLFIYYKIFILPVMFEYLMVKQIDKQLCPFLGYLNK
jgi:hypothetical protein